jgi:hypothetical protein
MDALDNDLMVEYLESFKLYREKLRCWLETPIFDMRSKVLAWIEMESAEKRFLEAEKVFVSAHGCYPHILGNKSS